MQHDTALSTILRSGALDKYIDHFTWSEEYAVYASYVPIRNVPIGEIGLYVWIPGHGH